MSRTGGVIEMSHPVSDELGPPPQGALEELARDDVARKQFLKIAGKTIGAAGAASAFAVFLAACGSSSTGSGTTAAPATTTTAAGAANGPGDIAILNYALTLEYLETEFYKKVVASGLFNGSTLATLKTFGGEEQQHVDAIKATIIKLGGTPTAKPKGKFPLDNAASVAKLAATVENLGAAAYLGQAANIQNKEVLAAALAIHTVEARHAAVLNTLTKQSPTPDGGFGKPMTMDQVLVAVKPFIAA
jgi:rubrerythrin